MRCEDIRKYLADYLTQPADLPTPVMEHVTTCGACKTEFAELFGLWNDMERIPAPIPDSAAMRARFDAAVAEAAQPAESRPAQKTPWWSVRPGWTLRVAGVAACAMIVVSLAISSFTVQAPMPGIAFFRSEGETKSADPSVIVGDHWADNTFNRAKPADRGPSLSTASEMAPEALGGSLGARLADRAEGGQGFNRMISPGQPAGQGGRGGQARGAGGGGGGAGQQGQRGQQDRNNYGGVQVGAGAEGRTALSFNVNAPAGMATLVARNGTATARADGTRPAAEPATGESYDRVIDNAFVPVSQEPLATFSTDVDIASYANVRRFLNQNQLPPRNAVRIEELINYFRYSYPQGSSDHPITAAVEVASAPWNPEHRLVRIGLKAKDVRLDRQPTNLVFLIDVSGSMASADKLPLLQAGLRMMTSQLTENDKVTIVTYAGSTGIALQATNGLEKTTILRAIDGLAAQGSTNGGSGIQLAYSAAISNFVKGGVNRVILATDGDFNVGITNQNDLIRLIEDKAKSDVFLSVLGFGTGNLKDSLMEKLADHGNGHYAYIDSMDEARKVLVDDIASTLVTVAKDVKIQVEFNPGEAYAYRLIGYENRALATVDFTDDRKDAGDMGAGHTVTALFEVVPRGVAIKTIDGAPLRFQNNGNTASSSWNLSNELINLKVRYKQPDGKTSRQFELPLVDRKQTFANASPDFRFASAVAAFGMILRDSPYKGTATWDLVRTIAQSSRNNDRTGSREEFVRLVGQAQQLWRR